MRIIDLTAEIPETGKRSVVKIPMPGGDCYKGVVYDFPLSSMSGTYLDFPGHIEEFDDGRNAANYPLKKLFLVETTVVRLRRKGMPREINGKELEDAGIAVKTPGLLVKVDDWNLASPEEISQAPFYGKSAIRWVVSKRINLFVSNVYENHADRQGVFVEFFRAGIACVCIPANLDRITRERIKLCAIPLKIPGAVQLPCRLLAVE